MDFFFFFNVGLFPNLVSRNQPPGFSVVPIIIIHGPPLSSLFSLLPSTSLPTSHHFTFFFSLSTSFFFDIFFFSSLLLHCPSFFQLFVCPRFSRLLGFFLLLLLRQPALPCPSFYHHIHSFVNSPCGHHSFSEVSWPRQAACRPRPPTPWSSRETTSSTRAMAPNSSSRASPTSRSRAGHPWIPRTPWAIPPVAPVISPSSNSSRPTLFGSTRSIPPPTTMPA